MAANALRGAGLVRKNKVAARLQLVDIDPLERDGRVCRKGERMVVRGCGVDDGLQLLLGEPKIAHVELILAMLKVGYRQLTAVEDEGIVAGVAGERVEAAE